jgi:predicted membrane-bound dolichyl-phosphate-mannose-protein mannosyltransferase
VLVEDMFETRDNIFNDRYLLGNLTQYSLYTPDTKPYTPSALMSLPAPP